MGEDRNPDDLADAEAVLAGERSYDAVGAEAQAIVLIEWEARISQARRDLDLASEFREQGCVPWVEADDEGNTKYTS